MENFRTLKLSTLIDIHSDFTDHCKKILQIDSKTQELEDFTKMILLVQREIERRQTPLINFSPPFM